MPARDLNEHVPVILKFHFEPTGTNRPGPVLNPPKPHFVYGRLLEKNGRMKMEDVQIIFEATLLGNDSQPPEPIATVRTEANGYFFIEYPDEHFINAFARVSLNVIENPVPIRLQKTTEPDVLVFPTRVIVVVELADTHQTDKSLESGCKELDVHEPKRILEEYSFYTLVRTTEPEILGFVMEEEDDISLSDVLKGHPTRNPAIFDGVLTLPVFQNIKNKIPRLEFAATGNGETGDGEDDISAIVKNIRINKKVT